MSDMYLEGSDSCLDTASSPANGSAQVPSEKALSSSASVTATDKSCDVILAEIAELRPHLWRVNGGRLLAMRADELRLWLVNDTIDGWGGAGLMLDLLNTRSVDWPEQVELFGYRGDWVCQRCAVPENDAWMVLSSHKGRTGPEAIARAYHAVLLPNTTQLVTSERTLVGKVDRGIELTAGRQLVTENGPLAPTKESESMTPDEQSAEASLRR